MSQADTPPLVLASQSPARAALLQAAGLRFEARPARIDEGEVKRAMQAEGAGAADTALMLAGLKARRIRDPAALAAARTEHAPLADVHAFGQFLFARQWGELKRYAHARAVRLIGEQHVIEDLGFVPSFADWVRSIRPEPWMGRAQPIHRLVDPFAMTAAG